MRMGKILKYASENNYVTRAYSNDVIIFSSPMNERLEILSVVTSCNSAWINATSEFGESHYSDTSYQLTW